MTLRIANGNVAIKSHDAVKSNQINAIYCITILYQTRCIVIWDISMHVRNITGHNHQGIEIYHCAPTCPFDDYEFWGSKLLMKKDTNCGNI